MRMVEMNFKKILSHPKIHHKNLELIYRNFRQSGSAIQRNAIGGTIVEDGSDSDDKSPSTEIRKFCY